MDRTSRAHALALALVAVALVPAVALAEGTQDPAAPPAPDGTPPATEPVLSVAIGFNPPFRWFDKPAVGVSGYVAIRRHHAIRLNYASYPNGGLEAVGTLIGDVFFDGDGSESIYSGRISDIGIGYQFYTRSVFEGLVAELGILRRRFDTRKDDEWSGERVITDATQFAGRALVGWSWLYHERIFLAMAVGLAIGRTTGTEMYAVDEFDPNPPFMTRSISRTDASPEVYLRMGARFGK